MQFNQYTHRERKRERIKERVGPVALNPDNLLEDNKEVGEEHKVPRAK